MSHGCRIRATRQPDEVEEGGRPRPARLLLAVSRAHVRSPSGWDVVLVHARGESAHHTVAARRRFRLRRRLAERRYGGETGLK